MTVYLNLSNVLFNKPSGIIYTLSPVVPDPREPALQTPKEVPGLLKDLLLRAGWKKVYFQLVT